MPTPGTSKAKARAGIAIVGADIGGLTAAATPRQAGCDVHVYKQASRCARVGAGNQMMPNWIKVVRGLGLGTARPSTGAGRAGDVLDGGDAAEHLATQPFMTDKCFPELAGSLDPALTARHHRST
jgi:2-polyprenyl-6-methoxyphenol hydroxylase-like FAD-dependent oxidoreductase